MVKRVVLSKGAREKHWSCEMEVMKRAENGFGKCGSGKLRCNQVQSGCLQSLNGQRVLCFAANPLRTGFHLTQASITITMGLVH